MMTPEEIVEKMEEINKISALFDWLEMCDGQKCTAGYEQIIASTCILELQGGDVDGKITA